MHFAKVLAVLFLITSSTESLAARELGNDACPMLAIMSPHRMSIADDEEPELDDCPMEDSEGYLGFLDHSKKEKFWICDDPDDEDKDGDFECYTLDSDDDE